MIVTCTSCQARFRIPDGKIGPKGAKVRCSKCKNVFVARPGAQAGEQAGSPGAGDARGPGLEAPPADPFAGIQLAGAAASADPFAAAAAADPFAAAAAAGPFGAAAPSGSRTSAFHLPVTDLSDLAAPGLAGGPPAAPPRAEPSAPAAEVSAAAPPAGLTALAPPLPSAPPPAEQEGSGPVASADDLVLEEPSRVISMAPPPLPGAAPAFDFAPGDLAEPGSGDPAAAPGGPGPLFEFAAPGADLGDPGASEPVPGLERGGSAAVPGGADFAGADPFAPPRGGEPFGADHSGLETVGPKVPTVTEPIRPEEARPAAPARPVLAARRHTGPIPAVGPLSASRPRGRLQGFLASAFSLAALVAVAGGLLSWWLRGPAGAERGGRGPVAVVEVSDGLYETAAGAPVLFVRGEVQSLSATALGRVAVRAEVVLGGEVLARAEGLAGAVPTPEEVAQLTGPEEVVRLRIRVASRAPERLEPGGALPFLLTFGAAPPGLRDAVLRVVAEPLGSASARAR